MMKAFLLVLSILPILSFGQVNKNDYKPYKVKADSIIKLFIPLDIFEKYVRLDSGKSEYGLTINGGVKKSKFAEQLEFKPGFFVFHYILSHSKLSGEKFDIAFTLDSSKQFRVDNETHGLINALDFNESEIISKEKALEIGKSEVDEIKRSSIRLVWYDDVVDYEGFKQNQDLAYIWSGRIVWRVESRIRFRGKLYNGIVDVDALTGRSSLAFPGIAWD
jgi:hypothetical protein